MPPCNSTRRRALTALPLVIALALATSNAHGNDDNDKATHDPVLDAVVVSAPSVDGDIATTPHHISVITRKDIEASTAQTVGELLSTLPNVHLRSFDGNDRDASLDIRGMGDTAISNVVVLVDGVRLNETDLSGADLTTVPLAQIERIEILRGGGAVRHGDGAVGGVIDIRTRGGRGGKPHGEIAFRKGSDNLGEVQAMASGGAGPVRLGATYRRFVTDGYRDNGKVDARDWTVDLRADFGPVNAWVRGASHRDTSGLPGPVSRAAFEAGDSERRGTTFPHDFSETNDDRLATGLRFDLGKGGFLEFQATQRTRRNPYIMGYSPLVPKADQIDEIQADQLGYAVTYTLGFDLGGQHHTLRAGYDRLDGDYLRAEKNERDIVDISRRLEGRVHGQGGYLELTSGLGAGLTLLTGYRRGEFDTRERQNAYKEECEYQWVTLPPPSPPIQIPVPINCRNLWKTEARHGGKWRNEAGSLGLVWQASPAWTVFASASSHFRNPNIDELMLASDTLHPQRGWTIEHGLRYRPNRQLHVSATVFWMRIEDEIYYGVEPGTNSSVNRNYEDPTRRLGAELELRWQAHERVALRGGFGYVKPTFEGSGADVPHVPRRTASAAIDISLPGRVQWTLSGRHVGRRYDGNDLDNTQYPRLPSYTVWDTALRVTVGRARLALGINNLTGKAYSALGYSGTFYPMPGRTAYASVSVAF